MEVFISWSGDRSEKIANALHDWLPSVIQSVRPFMSTSDIDKGVRWSSELAGHLEHAQFGLICLTQENLGAPWLLFEAGALSKSIGNSRVVPYLYGDGISQTELQGPLAQFQAALATKDSTLEVVKSINEASGEDGLELRILEKTFEALWPDFESTLTNIPEATGKRPLRLEPTGRFWRKFFAYVGRWQEEVLPVLDLSKRLGETCWVMGCIQIRSIQLEA